MSERLRPLLVVACLLLAAGLSCSLGPQVRDAAGEPTPVRTPRPTFTPAGGLAIAETGSEGPVRGPLPPGVTALPPDTTAAPGSESSIVVTIVATPVATTDLSSLLTPLPPPTATQPATARWSATPGPTATPRPTPYVVVNTGAVIARRGPSGSFEFLGEASQGQQFMILATIPDKSWWQVCCIANQPAWLVASAVTAQGPIEVVPAIPVPPTPTPAPRPTPAPTATPSPTPAAPFDIARGPEFPMQRDDGTTVIWVKVYENRDNPAPVAGYVLKVSRNGADVSLPVQSHNRSSGFDNTGPTEGSYDYNLKFEMAFGGEATWQFYLARPDGSRVSPISKFTTMGDSYRNQVVYVAYLLAR